MSNVSEKDLVGHRRINSYRTIWISDVHLGTAGCKAEILLDFLRHNESETLYLVGDIIDLWALKRCIYFPQSHNDVVQKILRKARKGTRVLYLPGNHDELVRAFLFEYTQDLLSFHLGGIEVINETVHETADGKQLLVLHGDQFDGFLKCAKWISHLGDRLYTLALKLNTYYNALRRRFKRPYWSLSAYLKFKVKRAVQYINNFEELVAAEARHRCVDGVVCGHIHHPEMRTIDGVLYCNDGDWVESCTALVEHFDGRLEVIHWVPDEAVPASTRPAPRGAADTGSSSALSTGPGAALSTGHSPASSNGSSRGSSPASALAGTRIL